ncbi:MULTISPECIES: flagellar hook-basal body complex protein FliE [Bacillus]|uniref:Flagellar hook-basal body complex protein FliE n=1 Tax=Bacillus glycinifermentans TaxID=1664069 RepID=A0AAJ4D260_9BACI|nr:MULTISPECIES: flagellar hook-basal body complex protein FliE [Bacillus]MDU0071309.1 flagellar hook-basal body complex protein FliE [Bacillus sp. IG6]MED8019176.1 flagellar hook-basal body complex protein FliE [Bacillus glycinifermentans]QAT65115.1 flagellar hook-basal body complex protein FliE [Bacillus glycinifermentans]WKB79086.1 flagellar hook-basal body complex protein FliE [Bacillus glycinifermentans]SCA85658.1 flagellar hook-basal body protein FliE [Bacillus glycinifermentans]
MINGISPFQVQVAQAGTDATNQINNSQAGSANQTSFSNVLKDSINALNQSQNESDKLTNALALGQDVNLDEVMIAAQKANVTLTAATEFRNKAVEAYQEIMRMQM